MADEEKTPVDSAQETAPKAEDKKLYNGKYTSVEELEKAHAEAESKIGQQGEDLKVLRQFQAEVYPIVDVVYGNDKIMSEIRQAVDAKYTSPQPQETESKENGRTEVQPDPKAAQTEAYLRQRAIDDFKLKHGLEVLSREDYTKVEEQLTGVMSRWILPGQPVPLDRIGPLLDDAYSIVRNDKLVEDKVFESLATSQTNQRATMGSMQSSGSSDSGAELSDTERNFAIKLGIKPEDAALYKKRYAEGNDESIIKN